MTTASARRERERRWPDIGTLYRFLASAAPGERFAYYHGFLARDRGQFVVGEDGLTRFIESEEIAEIADTALAAAEAGEVHLVQRKNRRLHYTYFAVKAYRRPVRPAKKP